MLQCATRQSPDEIPGKKSRLPAAPLSFSNTSGGARARRAVPHIEHLRHSAKHLKALGAVFAPRSGVRKKFLPGQMSVVLRLDVHSGQYARASKPHSRNFDRPRLPKKVVMSAKMTSSQLDDFANFRALLPQVLWTADASGRLVRAGAAWNASAGPVTTMARS